MKKTGLYDTLQIASNFLEQAEKLSKNQDFEAAFAMLEKAKAYAFDNEAMLDNIQQRHEALKNLRRHQVRQLEEEAARLFKQDPFDGQKAREVLQALRQQDKDNEIAHSLWEELRAKETVERERRLIAESQQELEQIWQQAYELAKNGVGSRALAEYERAIEEASKKAGDAPGIIPLQRLKLIAIEKRDQARETWETLPALIRAGKSAELLDYYEKLKNQDVTETEFFDETGQFVGCFPLDECLERAKKVASRLAEQKAQTYIDQAHKLLADSPKAAYDKIQEALTAVYPNDSARRLLEQTLETKIQPAIIQREKALAKLNSALGKEDPVESWFGLDQVEQLDRFTPGLDKARQQLAIVLEQKLTQLFEKGHQFQDLEEFELAQVRFNEIISAGQTVAAYNSALQKLYQQAREGLDRSLHMQHAVQIFEEKLAEISELSQSEPEQANDALAELRTGEPSPQALAKIERLQVEIDFRLGVDRLFLSLEQKMLTVADPVELIPIEEGAKQACLDYPEETRFPRLVERIVARRAFLKASPLCQDPEEYVQAMELLQQVVKLQGDDAGIAQSLLDKIAANEQLEADIAIALEEATQALNQNDARSAFLLLQPFRYAASRQAVQVRGLISTATTRWRSEVEQRLEALVAAENFILPQVEALIQELERSQSPRLDEWRLKALAPAYANTARDLQDLDRWEEAERLWEEAFRLAPKNPAIVEGRRAAHKRNAIVRAQTAVDPAEKERLLNDLNRAYTTDPTIKRYLAAFYFSQKRYTEAKLILSQAKSLLDQFGNATAETDAETIRHMEMRIQESEEIEKHTALIRNYLKGDPTVSQLKEARQAYENLVKATPQQSERLRHWWVKLIEAKINQLKRELAEISDKAGTAWERAELLCKILVLQADSKLLGQAQRQLKLAYEQLQPEIKIVVENPEGVGFGAPQDALDNHMLKAKTLHERMLAMNQLTQAAMELGLEVAKPGQDLDEAFDALELLLEKFYFIMEKRRTLRHQIVIALMTGKWSLVDDSLHEMEIKGGNRHRGLKYIRDEIEKAKQKRINVEVAIEQVTQAMAQEDFKVVQQHLTALIEADPGDETQLLASLEITDPFTGQKIKGTEALELLISRKLAVIHELNEWQAQGQSSLNWPIVRSKISKLANQGDFKSALDLAQTALGSSDEASPKLSDGAWSLQRFKQYLDTFPMAKEKLNSSNTKNMFDMVEQKGQILVKQINECAGLITELHQKEKEIQQILTQLRSLLPRLNERRDFLSSLFAPSAEIEETKRQVRELISRGRQLCPEHPAFTNFDESLFSKR